MSTPLNTSKPVRFAGTNIFVEKGKVDGKGNAEVTFKIRFSLADEHDQTTAYEGYIGWKIEIWLPGISHSNPQLDLVYSRRPETYHTHVDVRKIEGYGSLIPERSYRATDEEHRDQIWCQRPNSVTTLRRIVMTDEEHRDQIWYELGFRPIKLKVDVVEWRYNYELWFRLKGLFMMKSSMLYEGHKSEYWSLELR